MTRSGSTTTNPVRRAALAMLLGLSACRGRPAATPEANPTTRPPGGDPNADAQEAAAIADAIDPGPLSPLSEGIPPWLGASIGVGDALPDDPAALGRLADGEMGALSSLQEASPGDTDAMLAVVVAIARAAIYAERAAATGNADAATLARLERVYGLVDAPVLGSDQNLFVQILQLFAAAAAAEGHLDDAAKAEELGQVVFGAVRRAGPLHRRTVALLLRADPHHEAVPQALLRAAEAVRLQDDALAIRMGTLAVQLRGDTAQTKDWLALADLCHRALQVECGTQALARARALHGQGAGTHDGAGERALEAATHNATLANRMVALADARDFDGRLERARAAMALERADEARAAFQALRRDFPNDARPVAGLAKDAVQTRLDLQGANAIIDDAGPLPHGDAEYYELAIGTRAAALLSAVVPVAAAGDWLRATAMLMPMLARMRADIEAYEALGASDARYLRFVLDLTVEVLPLAQAGRPGALVGVARGLLPRAVALHEEIPDNPHAYRLMLGATQFSGDRDAAFAAARGPAPTGDAMAVRRLQALADLAVSWDDREIVEFLDAALGASGDAVPPAAATVAAAARSLRARLSGDVPWSAVEASWAALVGDATRSTNAAALNNLAVARAEAGDLAGAFPLWERAAANGDSWGDAATLNLVVQRRGPGDDRTLLLLAQEGRVVDVRLAARAWLVAFAADAGARKAADKALRADVAKESKDRVRPGMLPRTAGALLEGNLDAGLGYSTKGGLQIKLDSAGTVWLTFPPPIPIPDAR